MYCTCTNISTDMLFSCSGSCDSVQTYLLICYSVVVGHATRVVQPALSSVYLMLALSTVQLHKNHSTLN